MSSHIFKAIAHFSLSAYASESKKPLTPNGTPSILLIAVSAIRRRAVRA